MDISTRERFKTFFNKFVMFFSEPNEKLRHAVESFVKTEMHNTISKFIQCFQLFTILLNSPHLTSVNYNILIKDVKPYLVSCWKGGGGIYLQFGYNVIAGAHLLLLTAQSFFPSCVLGLNVYSILKHHKIVLTLNAIEQLEERLCRDNRLIWR